LAEGAVSSGIQAAEEITQKEKGSTAVGHLSINKYIRDEISTHFFIN
jgi:hypothetical protein